MASRSSGIMIKRRGRMGTRLELMNNIGRFSACNGKERVEEMVKNYSTNPLPRTRKIGVGEHFYRQVSRPAAGEGQKRL
jgi:hypothetical protein